jgi:hypothetical protein
MKEADRLGGIAAAFFLALVGLYSLTGLGCRQGLLPPPATEGGRVAVEFLADYRLELGKVFRAAAGEVEAGRIATDAELLTYLQTGSESARLKTADAIGVYLEKRLSNGELSPQDAIPLRELASGWEGLR